MDSTRESASMSLIKSGCATVKVNTQPAKELVRYRVLKCEHQNSEIQEILCKIMVSFDQI